MFQFKVCRDENKLHLRGFSCLQRVRPTKENQLPIMCNFNKQTRMIPIYTYVYIRVVHYSQR